MIGAMHDLYPGLITHFLIALSLGTALFSWIASPKLTGAGFIRLITGHGVIFLVLLGLLAAALFPQALGASLLLPAGAALLAMALQWWLQGDERSSRSWLLYATQALASAALLWSAKPWPGNLFLFTSFVFLGITHYAMLLGHYYLVVPKLSERPLLVCLRLLWLVMALKLVAAALGTWRAESYLVEGTELGDGFVFNWLVVSMRWLWGYVAVAVLSYFAWRLCRMRSIQSATGVLYIMVFFVFVGELLSAYLYLKHGLCI